MSSARGGDRGGLRGARRAGFGGRGTNASDSEGSGRGGSRRGRGGVKGAASATPRGASSRPRQRNLGPQPASHASKAAASKPNLLPPPRPLMEGLSWAQRYQTLKANRDQERKHAIAAGLIADPDKPRKLADAITIVGTCQDMCGEFERAERVYQNDVWELEYEPGTTEPAEHRMVKKFRRAAAGVEEQLPSDLRPPEILRRTCDYLFDQVLSETSLGQAHHFLWDRTRAIRNDFSIQQCTKIPDVRVQIDCLERIARFHIISMHQLATEKKPYDAYDNFQDREQLDKTLLTLMELYDANRSRYRSPNEGEFRAYCILFEMKSLVPNIEDRIQTWEPDLIKNPQVRKAVKLYNSACDTIRPVGPLNPRISHPIAQANSARFFRTIESPEVSYLMACVSEIEFRSVREATLNGIWQAYRTGGNTRTEDWTLAEVTRVLAFDDDEETRTFCEAYGFVIDEKADGTEFLDLTSVQGKNLPGAAAGLRKQFRSQNLVESKRWGRSLSAVINGLTVQEATERGLIVEDAVMPENSPPKESSLFVSQQESDTETESATTSSFAPPVNPFAAALSKAGKTAQGFPFGKPVEGASGFGKPVDSSIFSFGKPADAAPGVGQPTISSISSEPGEGDSSFRKAVDSTSSFGKPAVSGGTIIFGQPAAGPSFSFGKPAEDSKPTDSPLGQSVATSSSTATPVFSFGKPAETPEGSVFARSPFGQPTATQSVLSKPARPKESPFNKTPGPFTEVEKETEPEHKSSSPTSTSTFSAQSPFNLDKAPSTTLFPSASAAGPSIFSPSGKSTQNDSRPFGLSNLGQPPPTAQGPGAATPPGSPKSTPFSMPTSENLSRPSESEAKNPFGFTNSQLSGTSGIHFKPSTSTFTPAPATTPSTTIDPPQPPPGLFNSTKQSLNLGTFAPGPPSSQPASKPPTFSLGGFSTKASQLPPPLSPGSSSTLPSPPKFSLGSSAIQTTSFPPTPTASKPSLPPATTSNEPRVKVAPDRKEEKACTYQKITKNLVLEPTSGLLTQFIEHKAEEIIRNAMRQFEEEQEEALAREFRASKLSIRYVQLWKDSCAAARHKRRARERRKARRSAVISASRGTRDSRIENDVLEFKSTMAASTMRRSASRESNRKGFKDSFSSSIGIADIMARQNRSMDPPPRPPSTASERGEPSTLSERRSASHYSSRPLAPQNEDFRVTKAPLRYRASFLAGDPLLPPDSTYDGRISTTKTDYFRLRAMGINPDDVYPNRRKRVRDAVSEDVESFASRSTTPPDRKKRAVSREQLTATPSSVSKVDDVDSNDPLVARCRSLTKSFMDDISALRSLREQNERESLRLSQSSVDDSLARSYSDFRSSHFGKGHAATSPASSSLPKYWGRQSKFLPRSEYGGARWLPNKSVDNGSETSPLRRPELVADNKSLSRPSATSGNHLSSSNLGSPKPPGFTTASRGMPTDTLPQSAQPNQRASDTHTKSNGVPVTQEADVVILSSGDDEDPKPQQNVEDSLSDGDEAGGEELEDDDNLSQHAQDLRQRERRSTAEEDFYLTGSDEIQDAEDEIDEAALQDEFDDDEYESSEVGDDDDEGYSEQREGQEDDQSAGADGGDVDDDEEEENPQANPAASKYRNAGNSIEDAIEL
ncbi:SAC3/GANP/Nin1/mts3/eIF-3 p25 family-domain-containing protein [Phyllosticta citricarpa]